MTTPPISLQNAGENIIGTAIIHTVGYASARIAGASAAAVVGSYGTMLCVSAVGSAALYIPTMMLRYSLDYLGLMNNVVSLAVDLAYVAGSTALGAIILGVAIKPALICALIGFIMTACLAALLLPEEPSTKPSSDPILTELARDQQQREDRRFNRLFTPPVKITREGGTYIVEEPTDVDVGSIYSAGVR